MTIEKKKTEKELVLSLKGSLDTLTAPQLEAELREFLKDKQALIFDFSDLEYISSAGLRVLLSAQKVMNKQGSMLIKNPNESVKEVFEVTGFLDILNIEDK